jgi:hypothetical protein
MATLLLSAAVLRLAVWHVGPFLGVTPRPLLAG